MMKFKFKWFDRKPKTPVSETIAAKTVSAASADKRGPLSRLFAGRDTMPPIRLELRCRGKLIASAAVAELKGETSIGTAPDNDWRLPDAEGGSAAHHAKLILSGGTLKLIAAEGEKIYLHGEPLSECALRKKDRAAIGDAELFVLPAPRRPPNACDDHRLEVLVGKDKGLMIHLKASPFRIGSGTDNDLLLDSDVVSAHHAEIRTAANGESWIKDLNSSNGTFVNGERLGRQERMLMDSDEVSVAHFDYRFLDRNVIHTRTYFGKKVLIMGVTVLLVLFGFGIFYLASPTVETVIYAVDFYLFRNQYDAAERMLRKMPDSRGFLRYEKQYREYLAKIPRYRKVYAGILRFRDDLKNSQWKAASESYGTLEIGNSQAWNPADPNTEPRKKELMHAKELLDMLLGIYALDTSPNASLAKLHENWRRLKPWREKLSGDLKNEPEYLHPLLRQLRIKLEQQERNVRILADIDRMLTGLAVRPDAAQLTEFVRDLERRHRQTTGVVRIYVRELTFLLGLVRKNLDDLRSNDQALFDLRLADIRPVQLIAAADCMKIPQLYKLREQLVLHHQEQLRCREHWRGLQRQLGRYDLKPGKIPEEVYFFSDERKIEKTLELAALRNDPAGRIPEDYEATFGERYFYEVLQQTVHSTVNLYASDLIPDMKVIPKCIRLKDLYLGITETLLWFGLPQNQWLLEGKMKQTRDYYRQLLDTRPQVLKCFENIASRHKNDRQYFLARTAYFFFAPNDPDISDKMRTFAEEWREFRAKQQKVLSEYSPMDPESSRRVRDRIIAIGIPGDPIFSWIRHVK